MSKIENNEMLTQYEVIIVGAGPVGLTAALALGKRGINCLLVERSKEVGFLPKMDLTNPRSMEIFGRLGLAEKIIERAWPRDAHFDVYVGESLDKPHLVKLDYPSIDEMETSINESEDGSEPRYPYVRIAQYNLEALLLEEVKKFSCIDVRYGHAFTNLLQDDESVTAKVTCQDGSEATVRGQYLIGCDGGSSKVRGELGINYTGTPKVATNYMVFFRCDDLLEKANLQAFRHYNIIRGERAGILIAQDDLKHWSVHISVDADVNDDELDPCKEVNDLLGLDLGIDVIHAGSWTPHLLVAESYSKGRVFLAGDSAHQYIPTGGFGMNTGVPEAENIAWKIAAVLKGWASPKILESYQEERLPTAERSRKASEYAAVGVFFWRIEYNSSIHDETPAGKFQKRKFLNAVNTFQRRSHEQRGTEMGYRYLQSSIVLPDLLPAPDPDCPYYTPTASPGARLPHMWMAEGVSLHDELGEDMSLIAIDASEIDIEKIVEAAKERRVPLKVVRCDGRSDMNKVYEAKLILVRPDLHVTWRGDQVEDAGDIMNVAVGC
ncbi:FAD-dependent oxidoreductase [Maricurvus nonylphenolicus]|uniref:FAD-dependent monooxygenase n=1 Tax=Maricurvus nonylphenolicus TaxID=1008307 RepID=UPI0036F1FBD8